MKTRNETENAEGVALTAGLDLRTCPFCGGKATLLQKSGTFAVGCTAIQTCSVAPMPFIVHPTEEDAIGAWNQRKSNAMLTSAEERHE